MGVDHGRFEIDMAEQFLDGADIFAGFEEMGGKAVAEGVAGDFLGDAAFADRGGHGGLDRGLVDMMSAELGLVGGGDELVWVRIFDRFAGV